MISIEKSEVFNIEGALRGMRNPLESWDKSTPESDIELARRLFKSGSDHRKFTRQILFCVDITLPLYVWKEFDQYKIGVTTNSCSTMHNIHKRPFTLEDFSLDQTTGSATVHMAHTIEYLNRQRELYLNTKKKEHWRNMIVSLPTSYMQKRTVTGSYENLVNIYKQRKHHKLTEWHTVCAWVDTLPLMEVLLHEL